MIHTAGPELISSIKSRLGTTRDGQPISYNRSPAPDLAKWIARLAVTKITQPPDHTLTCGLFGETAAIRLHLTSDLEVRDGTGFCRYGRHALFFGPQASLLPIRVTGDLCGISIALRPGACTALMRSRSIALVDTVTPIPDEWRDSLLSLLDPEASAEDWLRILEALFRERISKIDSAEPDPLAARFEEIAFRDPAMSIAQAAREIGLDRRRLERIVHRDFGMSPKQVLRRARALDMAASLHGVADEEEAQSFFLRYYDESHLIHEFTQLFGMSPGRFKVLAQPLLTIMLEARQARRLEILGRLAPGDKRPWECPTA